MLRDFGTVTGKFEDGDSQRFRYKLAEDKTIMKILYFNDFLTASNRSTNDNYETSYCLETFFFKSLKIQYFPKRRN